MNDDELTALFKSAGPKTFGGVRLPLEVLAGLRAVYDAALAVPAGKGETPSREAMLDVVSEVMGNMSAIRAVDALLSSGLFSSSRVEPKLDPEATGGE